MAGNFISTYLCEESPDCPGIHAANRAHPGITCWGKSDRSLTCSTDSCLRGDTPIGRARACRSSNCYFSLARERLISCSLLSTFTFCIIYLPSAFHWQSQHPSPFLLTHWPDLYDIVVCNRDKYQIKSERSRVDYWWLTGFVYDAVPRARSPANRPQIP